jgi:hypothetical protein
MEQTLRECAIKFFKHGEMSKSFEKILRKLIYYIEAYCAELKFNIDEILFNDERWEQVWKIFHSIQTRTGNHLSLL